MYNKFATADILKRLSGYQSNPMDLIEELPENFQRAFAENLENNLKDNVYDSKTVISDSYQQTEKEIFRGMNYQTRRKIENMYDVFGYDYTLEYFENDTTERKTTTIEDIEDYLNVLDTADKIDYFKF